MTENKNAPVEKFKYGAVSTDVWKNEGKTKENTEYSFLTVTQQRAYTDKDNNWKNTGTLRKNDIPNAIMGLQKAQEYLATKQPEEEQKE